MNAMDGHSCNTYCFESEHCDLIYTQANNALTGQEIVGFVPSFFSTEVRTIYAGLGATVVRIERAREAPPHRWVSPPFSREILVLQPLNGPRLWPPGQGTAYLVWWRLQ